MKFCSIASGSSGNCIYAGSSSSAVLVDAGISGKRIEAGLNEIGQTTKDLSGILVTHEHSDHIKGLGVLARRYEIPIYATKGTAGALRRMTQVGKIPEPFAISHDAAEPVGFRISHNGQSCAVATDMGCYDDYIKENLKELDVLLLESNHDLRMLQAGRYPYYLKKRIMGDQGHLSNESCGQLLCGLLHDQMKAVFLGHLSQENNYEALAYETVASEVTMGDNPYRASDFAISIAHRDQRSEPVLF